jgi:dipeptidyl aminopeptidase/acylaminoacyl peptidase
MVLSGFDGTMEESYFGVAAYALEDGYNVMMFEGPGQAAMCHLHPDRPFMPDFEKPVGAAVDLALSRPDVDPDRLALMGISLGGYFAARAAVHDRRITACILNSPIIDMHAYFAGSALKNLVELPEEDYEAAMQAVPVIRWVIETFGRRFGARTVPAMLERMKEFNRSLRVNSSSSEETPA